jgi:hypothetical protein
MKKLALAPFLAVFAVSGAHAANVINDSPLYRPSEKHFYSVTSLDTDTDFRSVALGEEFGYGITDRLAVILNTSLSASYPKHAQNNYAWNNFGLALNYRLVDEGSWKSDIYGKVQQVYDTGHNFDDLQTTFYDWTVGTRMGYVASNWTVAGTIEYTYNKDDMSSLDASTGLFVMGLNGQYLIDSNWNLVGGLNYSLPQDRKITQGGATVLYPALADSLHARLGANYNIDATKYVGLYASKQLTNTAGYDEFGLGVKFGIDF